MSKGLTTSSAIVHIFAWNQQNLIESFAMDDD